MSLESDNSVLQSMRDLRSDMTVGFADVRSEMRSLRADVATDLHAMAQQVSEHKQTREQIVGLRRAVASTIPPSRLRRVEQHLDLPPGEKH